MSSLSAVFVDYARGYEQELASLVSKIKAQPDAENSSDLVQQVESERFKFVESIDDLKKEVDNNLPLLPTSSVGFHMTDRSLVSTKALSAQKKTELVQDVARFVEGNRDAASAIIHDVNKKNDLDNPQALTAGLRQYWVKAEFMWQLTQLICPSSQQSFEAALRWAWAKGEELELEGLKQIERKSPYSSPSISGLIQRAQQEIRERLSKKEGLYKVLCREADLLASQDDITLVESHDAYVIVIGSVATIGNIKKHFPVDYIGPLGKVNQPYRPVINVRPQYLNALVEPTDEDLMVARENLGKHGPAFQSDNAPVPGILIANFFTTEDRDRAARSLLDKAKNIRIVSCPGKTKLVLDVNAHPNGSAAVKTIANLIGLESLGEKRFPKLSNDKAVPLLLRGVVATRTQAFSAEISEFVPDVTLGLRGKGEIIAIADTGLDTGEQALLHPDFQGRVRHIKSYPITDAWSGLIENIGDDCGAADKFSGHGTHVAGSALGNGERARRSSLSAVPSGTAAEAELIFQAIEQEPTWTKAGIHYCLTKRGRVPPAADLLGLPEALADLFEYAYTKGARIHSNSWGYPCLEGEEASQQDMDLDRFVWEHKDFLVIMAAGNSATHDTHHAAIAQNSIESPGTAKNCLTVGASENDRSGQFLHTYEKHGFGYEPFVSDGVVDSIDDIAAFSSRGPCSDKRLKPDVVAPGTLILSTRSSQIADNHFAEGMHLPAKQDYMFMSGTSMATPLVAGCAALVRQFFREKHEPAMPSPSAALLKATLIHSAQYINYRHAHPLSGPWADHEQGWGRICLRKVLSPQPPARVVFIDELAGLVQGKEHTYFLDIRDRNVPLRITLAYTDYPGRELINNLNLVVWSPAQDYFLGNDFSRAGKPDSSNNVEGIFVLSPEVGRWQVTVKAEVKEGPQAYALVISGGQVSLFSEEAPAGD